jgi:peptidoglycan/LPS O-acetylase OafA/YrhL
MKNSQTVFGWLTCLLVLVPIAKILIQIQDFGPISNNYQTLIGLVILVLFVIPGVYLVMTQKDMSIAKSGTIFVLALIIVIIFCVDIDREFPFNRLLAVGLVPIYLIVTGVIALVSKKQIKI